MMLYRIELTPETKYSKKEPDSPLWDKFDDNERQQSRSDDENRLLQPKWTFPVDANQGYRCIVPHQHCQCDEVHSYVVMYKQLPDIRTDEQNSLA